jgi:pimeloyl-ACP methyl ester carboxylesterase
VPREREITVGGVRSPMIEAGPPDAPEAAVFVHGNPGSSKDWEALVDGVGEFGRAVAVDMPGFGQADKPPDWDYSVGTYAQFLADALEQLGIRRVHLIVHDFGGPFGLLWGLQHPEAWSSVVLINIGILPGYRWHKMARRWRTPVVGELVQAWIPRFAWRRLMQAPRARPLPLSFVDQMYDNYDRGTRRAVLKLYRATPAPGEQAKPLVPLFRDLDKPALVLWGAKDPFIGVEFAERQRESFPSAKIEILEDSGHWPFQDNPERVAASVLPFLRAQMTQRQPAQQ